MRRNTLTTSKLQIIYSHFQSLPDYHHKIKYLQDHKSDLEKYDIKVDNLINYYLTHGDKPYQTIKKSEY